MPPDAPATPAAVAIPVTPVCMPPKKQPIAMLPKINATTRGLVQVRPPCCALRSGAPMAVGCSAMAEPNTPTSSAAVTMARAGEAMAVIRLTAAGPRT